MKNGFSNKVGNKGDRALPISHLRSSFDNDQAALLEALKDGSRIFSTYKTRKGVKLWVITEAEDDSGVRCATTILLPEEY